MRALAMALIAALASGGCQLVLGLEEGNPAGNGDGDGDGDLENEGFVTPTDITRAYTGDDGNFTEVGPANWSCLHTPSDDQPYAQDVTLTGAIEDFQSGDKLPEATVTVYTDTTNLSGPGDDSHVSDIDGNFEVTLATGASRVTFRVEHEDALPTLTLNQIYEPDTAAQTDTINSVSLLTANALPAFIGVTRTVGLGILAGSIIDCDGNTVGGAVATVSDASGQPSHLTGAQTFYFSALSTSLPVRHEQQITTNFDGIFVVIELPESSASFLQLWGFVDGQDPATDEMTLLAEIPSPVLPDTVITATDLSALRTE
jgi:hypothetical protein